MTHNRYLIYVLIAGLLSSLAFFVVLFKLDPYNSTVLALSFWFLSMFLALASIFTLLGFYLRVWLYRNEIYYNHINVSLRQGVLLSLVAILCLAFQLLAVLTWWTGLLLTGAATLVEFYFTARI